MHHSSLPILQPHAARYPLLIGFNSCWLIQALHEKISAAWKWHNDAAQNKSDPTNGRSGLDLVETYSLTSRSLVVRKVCLITTTLGGKSKSGGRHVVQWNERNVLQATGRTDTKFASPHRQTQRMALKKSPGHHLAPPLLFESPS